MIRAESLPLRPRLRLPRGTIAPVLLLMLPAILGMLLIKAPMIGRMAVGAIGMGGLVAVALGSGQIVLATALTWLTFMGLIRRALIPFIGWPEFDPLLLVGPIAAGLLWYTSRDKRPLRTATSAIATLMFLFGIAQIFNPQSASVLSGITGSLFWLTPLMWFFVGRTLTKRAVQAIFKMSTVLLIPVAFHGLLQSFGFFFPFEYTWVGVSGFGESIFINGFNIRPFSSLTSPQEYGFFLAMCLIILWTRILMQPGKRLQRFVLFGGGFFALFLQGTRTVFIFFCLAVIVTTTMRTKLVGAKLIATGVIMFAMVLAGMHATRPDQEVFRDPALHYTTAGAEGGGRVNTLANHTLTGLLNPANTTAPQHLELIAEGIGSAFDNPFGVGVGRQTLVEKKIDRTERTTVENDVAAVFAVFGLFGGLLYVVFMMGSGMQALRRWRRTNEWTTLALVGLLVTFLTQWWAGQMYAVSAFLWVFLGFLARPVDLDFGPDQLEEEAEAPANA